MNEEEIIAAYQELLRQAYESSPSRPASDMRKSTPPR